MATQKRYFSDNLGSRKRRRIPSETPEIQDRLESLISRVGEKSTSSLQSNLEGLAGVLEADLPSFKPRILHIMADCIVRMPEKCTIYATLVGLINVKNYAFGGELVELVMKNLKEALRDGQWEKARYGLRFLSNLVNCHVVSAGSLLALFHKLLEVLNEQNVPQARCDWYAYCVMSALPWAGRELYEKKEPELDRLLAQIEQYMNCRSREHVPLLKVWSIDRPHPQEEYLDCLWAQLTKLRADFWQEKHILRPYQSFDSILCEALQHTLPPFQPPVHLPDTNYPLPWVVFRLFDYTDCPDGPPLPGAHAIERHLIDEQLCCILHQFHGERKECAAHLLGALPHHQLPLDYAVVELLLGEMLKLPNSVYPQLFYSSVLMELCRLQPSTLPQVLAQAAELLYDRIDTMQPCCVARLVLWFSHHLSNFQFRWSWEDWSNCLQQDPDQPQPAFVREVLEACMRLSYHQRVLDFLPPAFLPLAPPKGEVCYSYSEPESDGYHEAQKIQAAITQRMNCKELLSLLQELSQSHGVLNGSDSTFPYSHFIIDVFGQTLLMLSAKSMSHSFAAFSRFYEVLQTLTSTEAEQLCVLHSLYSVWPKRPQMICILVDKLLKAQLISCGAIANWLFSKNMSGEFTRHYVWDILHLTIRKMSKHVIKLEQELKSAQEKLQQGESDSSPSEGEEPHSKYGKLPSMEVDRPTPEMIDKLEERVEQAQSDQKNLFLRFIMLLSEHLVRSDTDGRDFNTAWYHWVIGRLRQVFLLVNITFMALFIFFVKHLDQVWKYRDTLETLLFTPDLDVHILDVFRQFCALKS